MSPKPTYNSVKEFFEKEFSDLVSLLDHPSPFWERVKANSFSNQEIEEMLKQDKELANILYTHDAVVALKEGRQQGKIHNPG